MPSPHPRIAVVRDPEVDRALERTRRLLSPGQTRSTAAHLRALALRGAEEVAASADPDDAEEQRLIDKHGLIPASHPYRAGEDRFPWLDTDQIDPDDPMPATDALNWVPGKDREY